MKRPAAWIVIMHVVGGNQRHSGLLRQPNEPLQLALVVRSPVKSDGKVTPVGENFSVEGKTLKLGCIVRRVRKRSRARRQDDAGQQPVRMGCDITEIKERFPFACRPTALSNEPGKTSVGFGIRGIEENGRCV